MPRKCTQVTLCCATCGNTFKVIAAIAKKTRYCSRACIYKLNRVQRTCLQCGIDFMVDLSRANVRRYCSMACCRAYRATPDAIKFFRHVDQVANQFGCTFYTGTISEQGYGIFSPSTGSPMHAHRFAFQLANGSIPEGEQVQHLCAGFYAVGDFTNRRCVNPEHLTTGSAFKNAQQTITDGRTASGDRSFSRLHPERLERGEKHHGAILTDMDVLEIRENADGHIGEMTEMAKKYGVNKETVSNILRRKTWTHI